MVGFAFIFLAVILLMPILLIVGVVDFLAIRMRPPLHLQRGFEVLPPTAAPREKK
jgi:hypothetical protein